MRVLQRKPNRLQNAVEFLANLMIPESQHSDSPASEEFRPRSIPNLVRAIAVPTTIQFDREPCGRTIEIEYVGIEWVLAAKFVACKISVPQMPPQNALSVGCLFA